MDRILNGGPWGIRLLDQDSLVLGLPAGTEVPQVVVCEHIRNRAAPDSLEFLVPPELSNANPPRTRQRSTGADSRVGLPNSAIILAKMQELCFDEWGVQFPKPLSIKVESNEYVINFKNHEEDQKPSTYVRGHYRRLELLGQNAPDGNFYLPDGMSADEFVDYIHARCGCEPPLKPGHADVPAPAVGPRCSASEPRDSACNMFAGRFIRSLAQTECTDEPLNKVIDRVRSKFNRQLSYIREGVGNYILNLPEGLGKTSAHFSDLVWSAEPTDGYAGFAFRKREQAEEKAREFRETTDWSAVVLRPFREHYELACNEEGATPIGEFDFVDASLRSMLTQIQTEQPAVFNRLMHRRRGIWKGASVAWTMLFTTHATASTWHYGRVSRLFNHPEFDPLAEEEDDPELLQSFPLEQIVWDEIELDEILMFIPQDLYEFVMRHKSKITNWRDRPKFERFLIFNQLKGVHRNLLRSIDYHQFDELMRCDLSKLASITVKFEALPFGWDNSEFGAYKQWDGQTFYIGARDWLSQTNSRLGFLTTESVMSEVLARALKDKFPRLFRVNIDTIPAIFPTRIPVVIDPRARRKDIAKLARDITDADPNALVICDMVRDVERVKTLQAAKGMNGLEERNIYVIPTYLNGEVYAKLNVIGQWLGIPNIIHMHYQDQINQAVGRNKGFRQSPTRDTKTVVVCSNRLWNDVLGKLGGSRTLLYRETKPCW